jgi:hypothetical protein
VFPSCDPVCAWTPTGTPILQAGLRKVMAPQCMLQQGPFAVKCCKKRHFGAFKYVHGCRKRPSDEDVQTTNTKCGSRSHKGDVDTSLHLPPLRAFCMQTSTITIIEKYIQQRAAVAPKSSSSHTVPVPGELYSSNSNCFLQDRKAIIAMVFVL